MFSSRTTDDVTVQYSFRDLKIDYNSPLGEGVYGKVYKIIPRPECEKGWLASWFPSIYDYIYRVPNDASPDSDLCVKIRKTPAQIFYENFKTDPLGAVSASLIQEGLENDTNATLQKYGLTNIKFYNTGHPYTQFRTLVHGKTLYSYLSKDDTLFDSSHFELRKAFVLFLRKFKDKKDLRFLDIHADNIMYDERNRTFEIIDGVVSESVNTNVEYNAIEGIMLNLFPYFMQEDDAYITNVLANQAYADHDYTPEIDATILLRYKKIEKNIDTVFPNKNFPVLLKFNEHNLPSFASHEPLDLENQITLIKDLIYSGDTESLKAIIGETYTSACETLYDIYRIDTYFESLRFIPADFAIDFSRLVKNFELLGLMMDLPAKQLEFIITRPDYIPKLIALANIMLKQVYGKTLYESFTPKFNPEFCQNKQLRFSYFNEDWLIDLALSKPMFVTKFASVLYWLDLHNIFTVKNVMLASQYIVNLDLLDLNKRYSDNELFSIDHEVNQSIFDRELKRAMNASELKSSISYSDSRTNLFYYEPEQQQPGIGLKSAPRSWG